MFLRDEGPFLKSENKSSDHERGGRMYAMYAPIKFCEIGISLMDSSIVGTTVRIYNAQTSIRNKN